MKRTWLLTDITEQRGAFWNPPSLFTLVEDYCSFSVNSLTRKQFHDILCFADKLHHNVWPFRPALSFASVEPIPLQISIWGWEDAFPNILDAKPFTPKNYQLKSFLEKRISDDLLKKSRTIRHWTHFRGSSAISNFPIWSQFKELVVSPFTQMNDDCSTNSHYLTYTFPFKWFGELNLEVKGFYFYFEEYNRERTGFDLRNPDSTDECPRLGSSK